METEGIRKWHIRVAAQEFCIEKTLLGLPKLLPLKEAAERG